MTNSSVSLDTLDYVLLIILIVSTIAHFIRSFLVFTITSYNRKKNIDIPCGFLKQEGMHQTCINSFASERFFINERCNKTKCSWFRTGSKDLDNLLTNDPRVKLFFEIFDFIAGSSSIILIVKAIF